MNDLLLKLQGLSKKIAVLEKQLLVLQGERHELELRLEEAEEALHNQKRDYDLMVERYEAVKLSKSLTNPEDRVAIQEKIDWYLKEIDICLNNFGE
ncbi:MAG: hypothetical protein MRZ79_14980 [Bacteroidia bacterium]|nr:hypothetical protein [Bacteroidia bacterium]